MNIHDERCQVKIKIQSYLYIKSVAVAEHFRFNTKRHRYLILRQRELAKSDIRCFPHTPFIEADDPMFIKIMRSG